MQAVLGLVEMTLPDKPNSRNQRYRLTGPGLQKRAALQDGSYR
ncbi:Fic family protein [Azomonas macrocytogenes]